MATYAEFFTPHLFFVTQRTLGNEIVLGNAMMVRLLQAALDWVGQRQPFHLVGHVFLPTQIQLVVEPSGTTRLDSMMQELREHFQHDYQQLLGMPSKSHLWEAHYTAQRLPDSAAFASQLDALHASPVHQGYVTDPAAWPYSSYQRWVARGLYPTGLVSGTIPTERSKLDATNHTHRHRG